MRVGVRGERVAGHGEVGRRTRFSRDAAGRPRFVGRMADFPGSAELVLLIACGGSSLWVYVGWWCWDRRGWRGVGWS